jgi:hypothetical protein
MGKTLVRSIIEELEARHHDGVTRHGSTARSEDCFWELIFKMIQMHDATSAGSCMQEHTAERR